MNTTMNTTFVKRLKELRKEKGMTQDEAAAAIGVGRTTWQGYETGKIAPPADRMSRIADLFSVPVDWLIGGTEYRERGGSRNPDVIYHLSLFVAWLEGSERPRVVDGVELTGDQSMIVAAALRGVGLVAREVARRG